MTPFSSPKAGIPYTQLGADAARMALKDAGIDYDKIQQAYVGWVYGDSTAGQAVLYDLGLTGIPIINVNNNCATGSSALFLARQAVESGVVECALALGFEQMSPGALGSVFNDRVTPLSRFESIVEEQFPEAKEVPMAIKLFAAAGYEYQEKYGTETEIFARVRSKASQHAIHNERAIFRKPVSVEEVMQSPSIFLNVTRLQCCPPTCGGAAVVVCTEAFARKNGLKQKAVILGQALTTDYPGTFYDHSMMKVVGYDMTKSAADKVYEQAGYGPGDVDLVELHDCFTTNEIITYEALGLCEEGGAAKFVLDGDNTYGGKVVTNPSGGLLSKGHPLGATGLAQISELVWQLNGEAGDRQVENARIALQHNIGIGGACVVTMLGKA
ncbi:lipid-transfer protein [Epilithonimonas hungarica]|nr:lipid-transfer protein [Epilithonimonas hungarica]